MILANMPKIPLQLTRIIHNEHTSVSLAKRYKIYLLALTKGVFSANTTK